MTSSQELQTIEQSSNDDETLERSEKDDLELARDEYKQLIQNNREMITTMMQLAAEMESPRMFEVLANSIRTSADVTEKLVTLTKTKKELRAKRTESTSSSGSITTNNNVFIGSTEELQRLLNGTATRVEKPILP